MSDKDNNNDNLFLLSSDDDDDSDDDLFSYAKTTFRKNVTVDEETPSSPHKKRVRRTRGTDATDTDDALSRLEQRRQHSKGTDIFAVDDDSDVEEASPAAVDRNANAAIEIDSSDDDDDEAPNARTISSTTPVYAMAQNGMSKEDCSRIQQARQASYHLRQAQSYHAEDVWIPESKPTPLVVTIHQPSSASTPTTQELGATLRVTLRTTRVVNGKRSDSSTTDIMTIRRFEPFQRLMERYQTNCQHSISPSESTVQFSFDGQTMDLSKTPATYDIEDEDLIDVVVETLAIQAPVSLGPHIRLVLRTRQANGSITNDTMSIREQEPLQKLVTKYKLHKKLSASTKVHFHFDGALLNLTKTPKFYDMETDDIIEV